VEVEQLRNLMKTGALSQTVAMAAIEKAEEEIQVLRRARTAGADRDEVMKLIRALPRAAEALRDRISRGNLGLQAPTSIAEARNVLFGMFGDKASLRLGPMQDGAARLTSLPAWGSIDSFF
jgi:hypothetical protein